ncbi:MAG: hypothetical protein L0215_08695 [Gemmataceae bacterium]|nr:hypothetical protein [Gemmataceae bacterium]
MNRTFPLVALPFFVLLLASARGQDAKSPVVVKVHEGKTEVTEAILPVDPTPRIQIRPTGGMGLGLTVDGNKMLCCGDGAIRTNFKIDDQIVYPKVGMQQQLPAGSAAKKRYGFTSTFTHDNIEITQEMEIVPGKGERSTEGKRYLDTVLIKYIFENKSDQPRKVGTRVRIDTYCVDNDGALFASPVTHPGKILNGVELKDKTLPPFMQILQRPDLKNPGFVGHYTLKMDGNLIGPNRFICTTHGIGDNGWETPAIAANGDSDCVIFWDPKPLPPNGRLVMAYGYGRSLATMPENEGRMKLAFGGNFEPGKVFSLMAYVEDPFAGQALTLELPAGLERVEGREIQPVPPPPADSATSMILWKIRVQEMGEFPVRIRSNNGVSMLRTISIQKNSAE